ncbi:MAG TPA: biotin--[acetyl-CoA-carboxylase] ligase [Methylovirgula sp.]|nr:biotin--[acetyl-CoA-carboxylase] ligase [Methylovirgula sp.]
MRAAKPFQLAESAIRDGFQVLTFETIGSTNDAAMALARAGGPDRCWLVARAQTSGRGRHGRIWASPPGNLYASLLLINAVASELAPQLGFVAGVALGRALRALVGQDTRLKLKWPNDVLFDGAKLGGILLEGTALAAGGFASVLGIGVNCISYPRDLAYPATALSETGAAECAPQDVFLRLSAEFAHWLAIFAGQGFSAIRGEWLSLAIGLGAPIKISTPARHLEGRFQTIDATGRLILENEGGVVAIEAGDVLLGH